MNSSPKPRILVVEDEDRHLAITVRTLERQGWEVRGVPTAEEALRLLIGPPQVQPEQNSPAAMKEPEDMTREMSSHLENSESEYQLPDLVTIDVRLETSGMDGIVFLQIIRSHEHTQNLPAILLTVRGRDEAIQKKACEWGVGLVIKPWSKDDLLDEVRRLLKLS